MTQKFQLKPWMLIVLIVGIVFITSYESKETSSEGREAAFGTMLGWAPKILKVLWGALWFVLTLKWLFFSGSGGGIPIWAYFILGFGILMLIMSKRQQPPVVYYGGGGGLR